MSHGLYSAVSAMDAAERRLDTVAHNLANVDTVAFKRRSMSFQAIDNAVGDPLHRVIDGRTRIEYVQGDLVRTGRALDIALYGEGWLAVELPNGEAFTRRGELRLDEAGVLLTTDGFPVAWETRGGAIDPQGEEIVIDGGGNVKQGAVEVGRLKIVDFDDPSKLRQNDLSYFEAPPGARQVAHTAEVYQYSVEASNVNPIEEMVSLIETQRAFQSAGNALSMIEDSYKRLNRGQ